LRTRTRSAPAFIDSYNFPDGELIGTGRIIADAQDAGFEVRHKENPPRALRHHPAPLVRNLEPTGGS
jgi:cyclopropane-fatty-acyl-phospholipid synthase